MQEVHGSAAVTQFFESLTDFAAEWRIIIITDPYIEEVAEDVQRTGPAGRGVERAVNGIFQRAASDQFQKIEKGPDKLGPCRFKMQIGDQQD